MKIPQIKLALFVFFSLFMSSCSQDDDGIYLETTFENKQTYSNLELDILVLVNNHRKSIGLNELIKLDVISSVALSHSKYMVEVEALNHDNFIEREQNLVINANAKSVGENVAYGYTCATDVVNAWLKSDSHRELIENRNFTHFGISIETTATGRNYFTQMFINK